jgi:hypothetical protein
MRKLLLHSRGVASTIAAVALLSVLSGHAVVGAAGPDGVIQACYQTNTGALRPSSIAARIRDQGPVALNPGETVEVPVTGATWTQGPNEFQDVVGEVQVETPCPSFAVRVVPLIRVFLDGQERAAILVTQPLSGFRLPSFEPGTRQSHTLSVTVAERSCSQFGEASVQSVKVDVLRARPGSH